MRSLYFWRMRSASALRFSNGCSSLNLERMMRVVDLVVVLSVVAVGAEVCEMCLVERGGEICRNEGWRR